MTQPSGPDVFKSLHNLYMELHKSTKNSDPILYTRLFHQIKLAKAYQI